jgi:AcrR family transcriptional regulator
MPPSPLTPTKRVRNPRGSGTLLGRQIVTTAIGIVDDTGAGGLTLRGLARTIGVSPPAIYAHFADIDAILLAVAREAFADLAHHLTSAGDGIAAPAVRLRAVCRAYLDYAEQHPGRYHVMFSGQWDATAAVERGNVDKHVVDTLGQDALAVFTSTIRACADTDTPTRVDPFTEAITTWLLLHGYAHQRLVSRAFPWPPGLAEYIVDNATARCLARSTGTAAPK